MNEEEKQEEAEFLTRGGFNRPWEKYDGRSKLCSICGEGPILADDEETQLVRGPLKYDWWTLCEACYGIVIHTYGKPKSGWPKWLIGSDGLIATTSIQNNRNRVCRELDKAQRERLDYIAEQHTAIQDEPILHYVEPDEATTTEVDITELGALDEEDTFKDRLAYKGISPERIVIEEEERDEANRKSNELKALVRTVIDEVVTDSKERIIIEEYWYQGRTQVDIAEELGMRQYQVSRILDRVLNQLKRILIEGELLNGELRVPISVEG